MQVPGPIATAHLFAPLHQKLIELLESLSPADWGKPTVCRDWAVRDIAAHLLDVDLRRLSFSRDNLEVPPPDTPIAGYGDLVAFLNRLNGEWVSAARRISPRVMIDLLRFTGGQIVEHVTTLDMAAPSRFSVAWAGEEVSSNLFDVARDYTERWHHQEQIRDAVGAEPLTGARWLGPVLEAFMRALPRAYRDQEAAPGTAIEVVISGEAGGTWTLLRTASASWQLYSGSGGNASARILCDADAAWRHLTKGLPSDDARRLIAVEGAQELAEPFFRCIAVMA